MRMVRAADRSQEHAIMHASEVTPEVVKRANELYWDTERSVNQIADELDLSKGALYAALEPKASGLGCPLCGDEVGWPKRTAKERDQLDCATCDWDGSSDETTSYTAVSAPPPTPPTAKRRLRRRDRASEAPTDYAPASAVDPMDTDTPMASDVPAPAHPPPYIPPRTTTIAGGALLGAAVGLALVMWARRR